MKIAYLELFIPMEDYASYTKDYSGGTCFIKEAKLKWLNSDIEISIFAFNNNFRNYTEEDKKSRSFVWRDWVVDEIKNGKPIIEVLPDFKDFDIIMHNHIGFHVNTEGSRLKEVFWSPMGKSEDADPRVNYRLNYLKSKEYLKGTKNYDIQIGPKIDDFFKPTEKEDYVFQCTRLDEQTNAIEAIENCNKYGIQGYFAGPFFLKSDGKVYSFNGYIDEKNTHYLGVITTEEKMQRYAKARVGTFLFQRNPSFSLSAVECLAAGTPIMIPEEDLENRLVNNSMGKTGIIDDFQALKEIGGNCVVKYNRDNFVECFQKAKAIKPVDCWIQSRKWSSEKMLESFKDALYQIYYD
jgi:hypothetical protein